MSRLTLKLSAVATGILLGFFVLFLLDIAAGFFLNTDFHEQMRGPDPSSSRNKALQSVRALKPIAETMGMRKVLGSHRLVERFSHARAERIYPIEYYWHGGSTIGPAEGRFRIRSMNRVTNLPIYDVSYTINRFHHRIVPQRSLNPERFAIFLGCSVTFGEGVEDNETYPAVFEQASNGLYRAYNFAFHGYGPNNLLARASDPFVDKEIKSEVLQPEGFVAYYFIHAHITRLLGGMRLVGEWGGNLPYYFENGAGEIVRDRNFENARPVFQLMANVLARSKIIQLFEIDWPPELNDSHYRFFAKMIGTLRNRYAELLPKSKFVVILPPEQRSGRFLLPHLEKMGIPFIDYSEHLMDSYTAGNSKIPYDSHPTPEAHRVMGEQLFTDLSQWDKAR